MSNEAQNKIIYEILKERQRQDKKWGEQNIPSINPVLLSRRNDYSPGLTCKRYGLPSEVWAKKVCDQAMKEGKVTFAHIVTEELVEVVSCANDIERRKELVQLGACVVQWIEAIDRSRAKLVRMHFKKA